MAHKRFDFTQVGGFPLTQEVLAFMQESYSDLSNVIAGLIGTNCIVAGVNTVGTTLTPGWIVYNNELLPFVGGTKSDYFRVVEEAIQLQFEDGINRSVKFNKYAEPYASGAPMNALSRIIPYFAALANAQEIREDVDKILHQTFNRFQSNTAGRAYNLAVRKEFDGVVRLEGVIYPLAETLPDGIVLTIPTPGLNYSMYGSTIYATAYFKGSAGNTFVSVCEIRGDQSNAGEIVLYLRALTVPPPDNYSCFVMLANSFKMP